MRRSFTIAAVTLGIALAGREADAAQNFRYYGQATAAALASDTITADAAAGGHDDEGNPIITKDCDARQTTCFDETAEAGVIPGLLLTGSSRTVGGVRDENGVQRQGFPRVESTAQASVVLIPDLLSVAIAPTTAIADSFTGELTATGGPIIIQLAGTDIALPVGEGLKIEGLLTLLPFRQSQSARDGVAIITADGAILEPDPNGPLGGLGPVILGHVEAGIEEPFTEGGGGAGSCSLSPTGQSSGGWQLLFIVGLLGAVRWIAERRRARTH